MKIRCVWEHNGSDTILYADNLVGAFTRGKSLDDALAKMEREAVSYQKWCGGEISAALFPEVIQEQESELSICDADTDVIFEMEKNTLTEGEYNSLKSFVLKSAADFYSLFSMVPDKNKSCLPKRKTFYGDMPRTANEMYGHTRNVNSYYFGEIGIEVDCEGTIFECRKLLRRFIWHDRIHAKAMYWKLLV